MEVPERRGATVTWTARRPSRARRRTWQASAAHLQRTVQLTAVGSWFLLHHVSTLAPESKRVLYTATYSLPHPQHTVERCRAQSLWNLQWRPCRSAAHKSSYARNGDNVIYEGQGQMGPFTAQMHQNNLATAALFAPSFPVRISRGHARDALRSLRCGVGCAS